MPNITTPINIPASVRPHIKMVCEAIGPTILGDRYPKDPEGNFKINLSNVEVGEIFEAITREFWRQQIQAYRATIAAETARQAIIIETTTDPFV